jgi:CheY-like chemotaxis protein
VAVKILVADDSKTMRQVMEMTFAGEDAEVVTVGDGESAIQRAKELRPDVVFADASMSTDGYTVAQAIKNEPALSGTAVIVLASQHHPFDEARASQAGVDDHVLKPFDSQAVIDKVGQVLGRPRATATAGAPPQIAAAAPASRSTSRGGPPPPPPAPPSAGPQAQSARPGSHKATVAFGAPVARPPSAGRPVLELADEPAEPPPPPRQAARAPAARPASSPGTAAAAATGNGSQMAKKLEGLGLTEEQVQGVLALSREVIEQVVWEVVPDLAETIIREEIRRLTAE